MCLLSFLYGGKLPTRPLLFPRLAGTLETKCYYTFLLLPSYHYRVLPQPHIIQPTFFNVSYLVDCEAILSCCFIICNYFFNFRFSLHLMGVSYHVVINFATCIWQGRQDSNLRHMSGSKPDALSLLATPLYFGKLSWYWTMLCWVRANRITFMLTVYGRGSRTRTYNVHTHGGFKGRCHTN